MPKFVGWLVGLSALLIVGALAYGDHLTIPWVIWIPLCLLVVNLAALLGTMFVSWGTDHSNERLVRAAEYLLISQFVLVTMTILGMLVEASPL